MSRRPAAALAAASLALMALLAGCGSDEDETTLTVLAAASLTETFTEIAADFEAEHDGVDVRLVFDSSATLAEQTVQGAPGDVLATADQRTMDDAEANGGTSGDPAQFATNVVVLAVPADNPADIAAVSDLDRDGVDYLTCVPTAPCGAAAVALLSDLEIDHEPASQEVDVKAVLAKVVDGEADAGFVYQTDVTAAGAEVRGIAVPGSQEDPNTYWAAVTANADQPALAREWIDYLLGDGAATLAEAGFGPGS